MKKIFFSSFAILGLGILMAAFFAGCGSSTTSSNLGTYISSCSGSGCSNTSFTSGDTESLTFASNYAVSEYAGMNITSATSAEANITLSEIPGSPNIYLGQMIIQYYDQNGAQHTGTFVNGTSNNQYRSYFNNVSILTTDVNNNLTYRIFFEDAVGALVLTMSPPTGTDTLVTTMSGQIYFSNFNSAAPNPLYQGAYDSGGNYYPPGYVFCWMVDLGPYDCRNFAVPPTSAYYDKGGKSTVQAFSYLGSIPTINVSTALGVSSVSF
jgi:hypothetical protein